MKFSAIVVFAAVAGLVISKGLGGDSNESHLVKLNQANYYTIDQRLKSETKDDVGTNELMDKAVDWLSSLEGSGQSSMIGSLRLFVSLRELDDTRTCGVRGLKIIRDNQLALTNLARYGLRPIDRVSLDFFERHASLCCSKYKENFDALIDEIGQDKFDRVKLFAREITNHALARDEYPMSYGAKILEHALDTSPINYIRLMDDVELDRKRSIKEEANILRNLLKRLSGDDYNEGGGKEVRQGIYNEYLLEPCRDYANLIESEIYQPVVQDEVTRLDSRGRVAECDYGPMAFRLGLAYYKVCQIYILGARRVPTELILSPTDLAMD